ncbi:MAG TPA: ChuX/HutX family heme-like substrate-binding protein [Gammaproteobacteria bacterium]|nr:ChuX/HutX family heme-like substrate-binding protein [Gammaproteobacteria bacterium]
MNTQATPEPRDPAGLHAAWQALNTDEPGLRIRDAAARLGVSEAELLATECGVTVTRLEGDWKALLHELAALGTVKTITRNESAVHETTGKYTNVDIPGTLGVTLGEGIDLRHYMQHWHLGFAQDVSKEKRRLRSLQFFDADGTAVHKVYLTESSDVAVYDALVAKYRAANQSPEQPVSASAEHYAPVADEEVDVEGLRNYWHELPDAHHFYAMLKRFRVDRAQALRLAEPELARPVGTDAFCRLLDAAAEAGTEIMIFVGSPGVAQIYTGPVKKLRRIGPWYNVLDPAFNLHLRDDHIVRAWIVRKGSAVERVTSLEIYDAQDRLIAQMFGKRKPGIPESAGWHALLDTLEPLAA